MTKTVKRGWGTYEVLSIFKEEGVEFKNKKLVVNPHSTLSMQTHHKRNEVWIVLAGKGFVVLEDQFNQQQVKEITPDSNNIIVIRALERHMLVNDTQFPLIIMEMQFGDSCDEEDIFRDHG